ncbi:MAG: enoyl-CoA hydratase/isomerase family protein [Pseudonocardia sp.]|uniref:enoyl-CoA hydratase/isomerase family protein n=1 Tax=unclassified Pseudonocardia TaxID=2619320 RepID=UPI00086994E1|nr:MULTISPECIES: enoyl-CoA hydratase-related protein [unclassified Pseudonocardia]MBN9109402.1 enoyl-CoA hydratase/isomerase family protein [Pseudonocardia sp.]ODU29952.1 MAG: enoyl-CoA hydratase [Pseudonocardia sp. SCN 72-51]ODV08111.1 MAG: enoyl-CoA hydratase [Pseudonocardia sp. SCN 73-27]
MDRIDTEVLRIEGAGPVRTVVMNRPDRLNAVDERLHRALAAVWRNLALDEEVRAVVLTGAGRAFSAGGDTDYLTRVSEDAQYRYSTMAEARRIVTEMLAFPKPIVAAVNGPAVGLGCSLAVLADVVFMSDKAFFADPHVNLGVVAADGGVLAWPLMMSILRAKEYLLTGDRIDAVTAERIGLANHVVSHETVLERALELAERLAAQPQQALRDTKRALNMHMSRAVATVLDFAFAAESETFALPEFRTTLDSYTDAIKTGTRAGAAQVS